MKNSRVAWSALAVVVVVGGIIFSVGKYRQVKADDATSQMYAEKMRLNSLDGTSAPDFTLTDEHGKTVSLSSLKGKVVVVQFMDPECTDICPIVSSEIVGADKLLGNQQGDVAFLTVNVNQYHESQADVLQFSRQHGLDALPNWYFLTGTTDQLKAVWKQYGIAVEPNPNGDVAHSSFMFFIDKHGNERYIANPDNTQTFVPEWSQGIAYYTRKLI